MESKICSKCNMMKTLIEYYFDSSKGKYRSDCKECNKKYKKVYHQRADVKEAHAIREKERRKRDDVIYYNKVYRQNYRKLHKTQHNIRERLRSALKSQNALKTEHTFDLISCSIYALMDWLEFTKPYFIPNDYEGKLHIDHFKPLSGFDLNDPYQLKEAFHWSNLRYLIQEQNLKKNARIPTPEDKFKMLVLKKFYVSEVGDTFKLRETCNISTTTSSEKSFEGTEVMSLPNGKNVEV